jgi:hypothetical protein
MQTPDPRTGKLRRKPPHVSTFPVEFEQLLLTAFRNLPFRIPLPTEGLALSFRGKLYRYFNALREENVRLDLIEMTEHLSITRAGCTVVIQAKGETWEAKAIRGLLGLSPGFEHAGSANGTPLQVPVPELRSVQALKQLEELRARNAGGSGMVTAKKL